MENTIKDKILDLISYSFLNDYGCVSIDDVDPKDLVLNDDGTYALNTDRETEIIFKKEK